MVKKAAIISSQNLDFNDEMKGNVVGIARILNLLGYEVTLFTPANFNYKDSRTVSAFYTYNDGIFNEDLFGKKFILKMTHGRSIEFIGVLFFKNIFNKMKGYDFYYFENPNFIFSKSMKYFYMNNMHPEVVLGNNNAYFEKLNRKFYRKPLLRILNSLIFYYAKRNTIKIQIQNDIQNSFYNARGMPPGSLFSISQCSLDFNKYTVKAHNCFNVVFSSEFTNIRDLTVLDKIIETTDTNIHVLGFHKNLAKIKNKYVNKKNVTFYCNPSEAEIQKILAESDLMINMYKGQSLNASTIQGLASGLIILAPWTPCINTIKESIPDAVHIVQRVKPDYYIEAINDYSNLKNTFPIKFERQREMIRQEARQQFDKGIIESSIKDMILKIPENNNNISIVTASLNEGANIKLFLNQVTNLIRSKHINKIDEIVIVDDGSTDNTIGTIEAFAGEHTDITITLVKRSKKMGTVDAQITGANQAKNEYILVMDCDMQHPVEYIENFVEKFNYGYDIIIGSRYIVGSKNSWEPDREIISRVATMIAHIMFPFTYKIKDPLSGYFLCKKSILTNLKPYRYMYKLLLYVLIFNNINKNYIEVPIEMKSRTGGESKVVSSYSRTVLMYSRELLTYYRDYNKFKLKIN